MAKVAKPKSPKQAEELSLNVDLLSKVRDQFEELKLMFSGTRGFTKDIQTKFTDRFDIIEKLVKDGEATLIKQTAYWKGRYAELKENFGLLTRQREALEENIVTLTKQSEKLEKNLELMVSRPMSNLEPCKNCEELIAANKKIQEQAEEVINVKMRELKESVVELTKKSDQVEQKLQVERVITKKKKTYGEVVKEDLTALIIQANSVDDLNKARQVVKQKGRYLVEKPVDVVQTKDNKLIVKMKTRLNVQDLKSRLDEEKSLENVVNMRITKQRKNRYIVLGVDKNLPDADVKQEIEKNLETDEIEIIRIFLGRDDRKNYIIDVDNKTVAKLEENNRIIIDYARVRIMKYINIVRCFKCQGFGHISPQCKEKTKCANCAQEHRDDNCQEETQCTNCKENNHRADSKSCPVFNEYRTKLLEAASRL